MNYSISVNLQNQCFIGSIKAYCMSHMVCFWKKALKFRAHIMFKSPDKSASEINHIQWVALDKRRQIHSQDHLGCLIRLSGVENIVK